MKKADPASGVAINVRPSDSWLSPASYWMPTLLLESAWHEHAPFAAWLIDALRPRTVVELGTHNGFSYFTWCECAARLGMETRFTAIDSWEGDEHAGFYSQTIFDSVVEINEQYKDVSRLLRGFFSDCVSEIEDGTVDLLHIDGRHGYEDVLEDFELYLPKVSSRGVVLFHDIAEHQEGFGVYRFWAEVSQRYPSFTFEHGHGLGVLFVGSDAASTFSEFLASAAADPAAIRADYELLGALVEQRYLDHVFRSLQPDLITELDSAYNELRQMRLTKSWRLMSPARRIMAKLRSTPN
jgi:predicted O-methyltransferase YrrM